MAKRNKLIGGGIIVDLNGYHGKGSELVGYEITATGLRVTLRGPLALALQIGDIKESSNVSVTVG